MAEKNGLKKVVLKCVQDMNGVATSRGVSGRLGYLRVSDRKKVSLTLLKCKRQGLLDRVPRKRGRVREYVYMITDRGRKRLYYWRWNGEVEFGAINIDEIAKTAKWDVTPLLASATLSVSNATHICEKTTQRDVFFASKQSAASSAYLGHIIGEVASAFAAKKLLEVVSPKTWMAIKEATKQSLDADNFFTVAKLNLIHELAVLNQLTPPSGLLDNGVLLLMAKMKLNEPDATQFAVYTMLQDERKEKETYKSLYESERKMRIELEEQAWRSLRHLISPSQSYGFHKPYVANAHFGASLHAFLNLFEAYRFAMQTVTETNQQLMNFLIHRKIKDNRNLASLPTRLGADKGNGRLQAKNTQSKVKIHQISDPPTKPMFPVIHSIPPEASENMEQSQDEEPKPSAPEDCYKKPENEESWEDFNSMWWHDLRTLS